MTPLEAWALYTDFTVLLIAGCSFLAGWMTRAAWDYYAERE